MPKGYTIDAAMCTVCATSLLRRLVDLDMLDGQDVNVQSLGLGIAFGVLEEREQKVGALFGPASLRHAPGLSLGASANASLEAAEWNALLLGLDVLEKALRLLQAHSLDGHGCLPGIFEVNAKIRATRLAGYTQDCEAVYTLKRSPA